MSFLPSEPGFSGQAVFCFSAFAPDSFGAYRGKRFNAPRAAMVVHSFSQVSEWFEDYANFLKLFGVVAEVGELVCVGERDGVELFFGWVKGAGRYLER